MRGKRVVTFLLALSFVSSTFYLPVFAPTPRAQAQWAVIDVKAYARELIDGIGMILAQEFIDQIVSETVEWANSGFEGNPVYAVDPKRFFTDIADGVAGEFILGSDLGFVCSPFQAQIRIALANYHVQPTRYQCTLTDVVDNIKDFSNNLDSGGWDNWYVVTQNPANNPYGAYLEAQIELDRRVAEALGLQKQELDWGQGFLNTKDCIRKDPDTEQCLEYGPTKTPGATIKAQLDEVLPSGIDKLITVNHIEQLIGAVAVGLLKRFVFSDDGLFSGDQGDRNDYFSRLRTENNLLGSGIEADKCAALRETGVILDADCNPIFSSLPPGTGTGTAYNPPPGTYVVGAGPGSGCPERYVKLSNGWCWPDSSWDPSATSANDPLPGPDCYDGIQNQDETDVDTGGVCIYTVDPPFTTAEAGICGGIVVEWTTYPGPHKYAVRDGLTEIARSNGSIYLHSSLVPGSTHSYTTRLLEDYGTEATGWSAPAVERAPRACTAEETSQCIVENECYTMFLPSGCDGTLPAGNNGCTTGQQSLINSCLNSCEVIYTY